ncbi:MAG: protein-glutamate O-methyltransferase CheR, partial [Georgfuchsia sp.]
MNDMLAQLNGETYFFRDHGQFDLLRLRLLPELIERRRDVKTLRLWSAGCSSGEEAYSLAMLLDMLLPQHDDWNISILGSDIDETALVKARQGRYRQWSFRMAPPELKHRYFQHNGDEWKLIDRIRNMVTFSIVNLIDAPFPNAQLQNMDLILCRNVFIYFNAAAVTAVANKLAATLNQGGYLLTAHTELIGHRVPNLQNKLFPEGVVYQQIATSPNTVTPKPTHIPPAAAVTKHAPCAPCVPQQTAPVAEDLLAVAR